MKFYLDTEFNGFEGELISLALVSEQGDEWYEVLNYDHLDIDDWVKENVIPILNKNPISKKDFVTSLKVFLNKFKEVEIIADWPDDIAYFNKALITGPGKMIQLFSKIKFELDLSLSTKYSKILHNALEDAKSLLFYEKNKK